MAIARRSVLGFFLVGCLAPGIAAAERPSEQATAAHIDALFQRYRTAELPPLIDDQTFLRRVSLDLTGRLPSPDELRRIVDDSSPDKRAQVIDRLLDSEAYAINWGRYWRDAVTYHTPASGNYLRWKLFDGWWTEQLRRNRPWSEIVTELVTASGVNDETAPVNYLTALYGNPVEIAATTSRVFLGVRIQCAQCHDAKNEPWKREQFHALAAFFGRARLVQHKDVNGRGTPYAIECKAEGQYQMTDKADPARLIPMQPRMLTGESVAFDTPDLERRRALARWLTSPQNPWFARCYVNRIWSALVGWGFYPAVDDLGNDVAPIHPKVLTALEQAWIASGYDMRWLFRTITLTDVYQRQLQPVNVTAEDLPGVCPVQLRAEQVFEALQNALAFNENDTSIPAPAPSSAPAVQRHSGLRNMVYMAFKEDPSAARSELHGTIPQALLLMNSRLVHMYTSSKGKTILAELLAKPRTNEEMVEALYERVLARKPAAEETQICLRYIGRISDRAEAFEDILWGLVNSTEFLIKK
jgi:hypothetical protein